MDLSIVSLGSYTLVQGSNCTKLKCIPLNNFGGTGNITINGGEFPPGMYM